MVVINIKRCIFSLLMESDEKVKNRKPRHNNTYPAKERVKSCTRISINTYLFFILYLLINDRIANPIVRCPGSKNIL